LSKFTGIGGIATIIFACLGAGFAFGRYYAGKRNTPHQPLSELKIGEAKGRTKTKTI
jgi:hypothetical protein